MEKIVVVGGGGHANVIVSILKKNGNYDIIGYTEIKEKYYKIRDVEYLGNDEILKKVIVQYHKCSAVIGVGLLNWEGVTTRLNIKKRLIDLGYDLPAVISPDAIINEDVRIDEGTVVCDGVVVNCRSKIGNCSIVNTGAIIDHDCCLGDNVHVAPGVTLSGGVVIGNNSFIGAGTTIIQNRKIKENCIIGAGALVLDDIIEAGKYFGSPAKRII